VRFYVQLAEREDDLQYYVPPWAVPELPSDMTSGQFVAKLEAKEVDLPEHALAAADKLLTGGGSEPLLLVLGEAGSGKSLFLWTCVRQRLSAIETVLSAPAGEQGEVTATPTSPGPVLWLPLVIDLKQYKVSQLPGLLARYLSDSKGCRLPTAVVDDLVEGRDVVIPGVGRVGLLVLFDGFDELQTEGSVEGTAAARSALKDFMKVVVRSARSPGSVRAVVTSRESRLVSRADEDAVFGTDHARRVLLPFSRAQVSSGSVPAISYTCVCPAGLLTTESCWNIAPLYVSHTS
jgi:hypothetical protein